MNGLHPIKMPSAKEKVAAELRKAILSLLLRCCKIAEHTAFNIADDTVNLPDMCI